MKKKTNQLKLIANKINCVQSIPIKNRKFSPV